MIYKRYLPPINIPENRELSEIFYYKNTRFRVYKYVLNHPGKEFKTSYFLR